MNLRQLARDESCVRCGAQDGTVVLAHYTGARRLSYGGGFGIKVRDIYAAYLCSKCHSFMDREHRDKVNKWEHSEEFQHYILLTIGRLMDRGRLVVK